MIPNPRWSHRGFFIDRAQVGQPQNSRRMRPCPSTSAFSRVGTRSRVIPCPGRSTRKCPAICTSAKTGKGFPSLASSPSAPQPCTPSATKADGGRIAAPGDRFGPIASQPAAANRLAMAAPRTTSRKRKIFRGKDTAAFKAWPNYPPFPTHRKRAAEFPSRVASRLALLPHFPQPASKHTRRIPYAHPRRRCDCRWQTA